MEKKEINIAILILAAGSSSRLGHPKQLLEIDGITLLQKSILNALEVSETVVVVLGANERLIRPTISDFPVKIVLNKKWESGMSSSLQAGMLFLENKKLDGVLILLTDQPFVNVVLLKKLISTFKKSNLPIIASEYDNKLGVPAIFDNSFFEKLKSLKGQKGAKKLILNNQKVVKKVFFEKGKIDIDTEEDWRRFNES